MKHSSLQYLYHRSAVIGLIRYLWFLVNRIYNFVFVRIIMWSDERRLTQRSESVEFVPERDVKFLLWTRLNPEEAQILSLNDPNSLKESFFDEKNPVRFLIHGWLDNGYGHVGTAGRKAYLQYGNINVVSVDWSPGADTPNYFKSRSLVVPVGQFVASFIDFLVEQNVTHASSIYLVGHSLGAHIAGIAGKHTKNRVNTIFGLDPAGLMFFTFQPKERLDVMDAKYVEVIHTSYQGFGKPIGYADFYVNGGNVQPGCNILMNCSHLRSIEYWAESINSEVGFYATPLDDIDVVDDSFDVARDVVKMGGEPSNTAKARGSYKVETNDSSPYAKGPVEHAVKEVSEKISFLSDW